MSVSAALLFDFDGTLVDSIEATGLATNSVLRNHGKASVSPEEILIGTRYETRERFRFHSRIDEQTTLARMAEEYYAALADRSDAIERIAGLFEHIARYRSDGIRTGIVSNNRGEFIRTILSAWGIRELFDIVVGDGDGSPAKPDPGALSAASERFAIPSWRTAFIGDGEVDAETARNYGAYSIGVTWVHQRHGVNPPDGFPRTVASVTELDSAIERWLALLETGDDMFITPKRLFFVRHCQSEANALDILASRKDYGLSPEGRREAAGIAQKMSSRFPIDAVLSSPLTRARQTAAPIAAELGLEVTPNEYLTEHDLGIFSGMTYRDLSSRSDYQHDRTKRWLWRPDGGESYRDIYDRVIEFFFKTIAVSDYTNILCVTHAVTLRLVRAFLENSAPRYPEPIARNGEVWQVDFATPGRAHGVTEHHLIEYGTPPAKA